MAAPADRGRVSARVMVRFADNELLEGRADGLDMESPDFELILDGDAGINNRSALIPLPSVKCVTLHRGRGEPADRDGMQKVALRFRDGEVRKGLIGRPPRRARHGLVVELHTPDGSGMEVLGIPYGALKAVFYLRSWDGRPSEHLGKVAQWVPPQRLDTPLMELLGDIARLAALRDRGEITGAEFRRRRQVLLDLM